MKHSLVELNKLFRAFLPQSEKMLFKQAATEAIHHLVWCCPCSWRAFQKAAGGAYSQLATVLTSPGQLCSCNSDSSYKHANPHAINVKYNNIHGHQLYNIRYHINFILLCEITLIITYYKDASSQNSKHKKECVLVSILKPEHAENIRK